MTFRDKLLNWSFVASILINCAFAIWIGKSDIFQSHTSREEIQHMTPVHITHPPIKRKPPPPKKVVPPKPVKVIPRPQTPQRPQPVVRPVVHVTVNTGTHTTAVTPNAVYVPPSPPEQTTTAPPDTADPTPPPPAIVPPPTPPVVVAPPPPPPPVHHDPPPPPPPPDRYEPTIIGDYGDLAITADFDTSSLTSNEIVVDFVVDPSGHASRIKIVKSSGNTDLDNQALDKIRSKTFRPATRNGIPQSQPVEHTYSISTG